MQSGYEIVGFFTENNALYFNTRQNEKVEVNLPEGCTDSLQSLANKYMKVSHAHVIDSIGFALYQPRQWRPFVPLPDGTRNATQWEFDKFCYDNPDSRIDIDINALVWSSWINK